MDPTDLGSYASALNCTICMKKTPDMIGSILSCPFNTDQWQCNKCQSKFSTVNIQNLVVKIHGELEKVIDNPLVGVEDVEKLLKKYRYRHIFFQQRHWNNIEKKFTGSSAF